MSAYPPQQQKQIAQQQQHALAPHLQPGSRGFLQPGQIIQVNTHVVSVERYLSQGGFAHVYIVQSQAPINGTRQHVLKRIAVADENFLREVKTEVDVMRVLRGHPNIVNLIDATSQPLGNGSYEVFILMEFCPGGGIIDMMNRRLRERLTESEILQIFVDVCEGVACMHYLQPPLLHRDLKVENILQAGASSFKLCDFGSAAPAASRGPSTTAEIRALEADLNRHTTLQYRAPEMVDVYLRRPVDEKSDIWALGVLLYKLCYYTTPFEEHGPLAILNVSYRTPPYPVYSPQMNALIASMLQEHGTQRPSVFDLLDVVHRMRGTKSAFHYSRRPTPSQPTLRQAPVQIPSQLPSASAKAAAAQKQVMEAIEPMRRGRPSVGAGLSVPAAAPLSPIKSGPSRIADSPLLGGARGQPVKQTIHQEQIARFDVFPSAPSSSGTGNAGAWDVPSSSRNGGPHLNVDKAPPSRSTSPSRRPTIGFADSFTSASSSQTASSTRPTHTSTPNPTPSLDSQRLPPLPTRSRPGPPARTHHRTGPTPQRDAFEGLGSVGISSTNKPTTLGSLVSAAAAAAAGTGQQRDSEPSKAAAGTGLRSPSAPYASPRIQNALPLGTAAVSSATVQHLKSPSPSRSSPALNPKNHPQAQPRPSSSMPSSELSAEERFPSIEALDRHISPPAVSSTYRSPSPQPAAKHSASLNPPSDVTRTRLSPSKQASTPSAPSPSPAAASNRPRMVHARSSSNLTTPASPRPQPYGPPTPQIPGISPLLSPGPNANIPSSPIKLKLVPKTNVAGTKRTSMLLSGSGPRDGALNTSGDASSSERPMIRRNPTTPAIITAQAKDWLTGDDSLSSSTPSAPRAAPSGVPSNSAASTRIPRRSVAPIGTDLRTQPSTTDSLKSLRSAQSANESSGSEEGPEDVGRSVLRGPNASRSEAGRKPTTTSNHAQKSSVYDLIDVRADTPSRSAESKSSAAMKRRSVQNLIDIASPNHTGTGAGASRNPARQAVHDLVEVSSGSRNEDPQFVVHTSSADPDSLSGARERFPDLKTVEESVGPSAGRSLPIPTSDAPDSIRRKPSTSSRPRPHSMFIPSSSSNFLSPPSASDDLSPSSSNGGDEGASAGRPRHLAQRRLSISDMVSKYEALQSPGGPTFPTTGGGLHRTPSAAKSFMNSPVLGPKVGRGDTTLGSSHTRFNQIPPPSPAKPISLRSAANEPIRRALPQPQSQAEQAPSTSTPRNHLRPSTAAIDPSSPRLRPTVVEPPSHVAPSPQLRPTVIEPESIANPVPTPMRNLNVRPPADFPVRAESLPAPPLNRGVSGKSSPPHSPSPERPYQGVSKLIDQWQKKTEALAEPVRKPPIGGRAQHR